MVGAYNGRAACSRWTSPLSAPHKALSVNIVAVIKTFSRLTLASGT